MLSYRLHRGLIGLFIGLFLCFQIASTAHAARYEDAPHEHDGVGCLLGAVAAEDQAVEPESDVSIYEVTVVCAHYETDFTSAKFTIPQGRAPPPRSPPLTIL